MSGANPVSPVHVSSSLGELNRFLLLLLLRLVLPCLFVSGFVELVAWETGTTAPPEKIARLQEENRRLVWAGGNANYYPTIMLARVADDKPDIVAIGHSRGCQLRSAMFKPYKFYNLCISAWTFDQMSQMIELVMQRAHPKFIVLNVDYYMFTDKYAAYWEHERSGRQEYFSYGLKMHLDGLNALGREFAGAPLTTTKNVWNFLLDRNSTGDFEYYGLPAINSQSGFRYDGSLLTGLLDAADPDQRKREAIERNSNLFAVLGAVRPGDGAHISQVQLGRLRALADLATREKTTIIGVQLPYLKSAVDILDNGSRYKHYLPADGGVWQELQGAQMQRILYDMGIRFFDLSHLPVGEDSEAFLDPAHPDEQGVLASIIALAENPEFRNLLPDIDLAGLRATYEQARRSGSFINVYRDRF